MKNKKIFMGMLIVLLVLTSFMVKETTVLAALNRNTVMSDGGGGSSTSCSHKGGTATCQSKAVCEICGKEYGSLGEHNYSANYTTTRSATCTVTGYRVRKCQTAGCTATTGGTEIPKLRHNLSSSFEHISGTRKHGYPCQRTGCTYYGTQTDCSLEDKADQSSHWKECSVCGEQYDKAEHTKVAVNTGDITKHIYQCKGSSDCLYYIGKAINLGEENHALNKEGQDEHECTSCGYKPGTHHGFANGASCQNRLCNAELVLTEDEGTDVINNLPRAVDYYMIGYGGPDWEKEPPAIVKYTTNYTPYSLETGTEILDLIMNLGAFTHDNYAGHAGNYAESANERNPGVKATDWPIDNIPKTLGNWKNIGGTLPQEPTSVTAKYSEKTYTINNLPDGHYIIYDVCLRKHRVFGYNKMYRKGVGEKEPTDIYAYLKVGYRDMNGNSIVGAPADFNIRHVTWVNGNKGEKFTFSPNGGSVTLDLNTLNQLGWRYKGYKHITSLGIPSNITSDGLVTEASGSIPTELGKQVHTIVFFFEPVQVTVVHKNTDRTTINTNKNCTYNLPDIINVTGHACTSTSLQCGHTTINESGKVPGTVATVHNNTSLNKYLWPGYILTGYSLKRADGKELSGKTYDLINDDPSNGEPTTRVATSGDIAKYGDTIPRELYQKTVPIATNINTGDSVGYRQDLILEFNYTNVDVTVSHRDYDNRDTILKDKVNKDLAYTQTLNGHYFIVSSLITQGEHTLSQTGGQYDITGRIIRRIEITKKNKIIWEKEFDLQQKDDASTEGTSVTNLLYYIISSNDLISELIAEINRIGSDIEFKFYYDKVPMLTIKHQDELGNKLWPDEYLPLINETTPVNSKELGQWNYVYKEHTLDGTIQESATQVDLNSDVRIVNVPLNADENRVLVFIYKQDIPTLIVKYVDESGTELANPTEYKMVEDTISTSAKDLSGKNGNGNSYEYRDYTLYEGGTTATTPTKTGTDVTVTVPKNGNDRLLIFVYKLTQNASSIDTSQIKSESVILKSNYRDTEEYNVLRAIPTSEDLYANVITDSFLLSNVVSQADKEAKVHIKLVQPYYKTNNEDNAGTGIVVNDKAYVISSDGYIDINIPYSYFTAKDVQLNIISKAVVKNESIEVRNDAGTVKEIGKVTLTPNYEKEPELEYKQGGELVFNDLANNYPEMAGLSIEKYVEGLKSGEYNLKSGFYNVTKDANGEICVEYVLPEIQYTEVKSSDMNKIVKEYRDNTYLLTRAAEDNDVRVTMDTLKVIREDGTTVTVLSGSALPINREYTLIQLEAMKDSNGNPILDTTPEAPLISNNVLYKADEIYITKTKANKEYSTTADIYYIPRQRVNPDTLQVETIDNNDTFKNSGNFKVESENGKEILVESKKDIPGNSIFVHTPVVNNTTISDNKDGINNNKLIGGTKDNSTLVLGQEFTIKIPNKGTHINENGYGTKEYNYKGLVSPGDDQVKDIYDSFAKDRQIRFTFGVIYNNTYYAVKSTGWTEWISLGVSDNTEFGFKAPEWEEERWKNGNHHTIETRVIAENCTDDKLALTQAGANKDSANYVATSTINVKLIGELIDLEIRATNDPMYSNYKTEGTSGMPIGQAGQSNAGNAYKYGLKLGYSVYFDITSTGWTGDTTENVKLTPKYYYVSKNGGTAEEVKLWYKMVGKQGYVSLENVPRTLTTIMSTDAIKGSRCKSKFASLAAGASGYFNAAAGQEMANSTRLITALRTEGTSNYLKAKNKQVVNYALSIETGTTKEVVLPYTVRLAYTNAVNAILNQKYDGVFDINGVSENVKNYCIGHWYGAFKLPATTVATDGEEPKLDKSNVKKDGYIIVAFENVHSTSDNTDYLEVDPDRYSQEGADKDFALPNGNGANIPNYVPAIIYETDVAANQDAEVAGSH